MWVLDKRCYIQEALAGTYCHGDYKVVSNTTEEYQIQPLSSNSNTLKLLANSGASDCDNTVVNTAKFVRPVVHLNKNLYTCVGTGDYYNPIHPC